MEVAKRKEVALSEMDSHKNQQVYAYIAQARTTVKKQAAMVAIKLFWPLAGQGPGSSTLRAL
jgi:hypothetical protein